MTIPEDLIASREAGISIDSENAISSDGELCIVAHEAGVDEGMTLYDVAAILFDQIRSHTIGDLCHLAEQLELDPQTATVSQLKAIEMTIGDVFTVRYVKGPPQDSPWFPLYDGYMNVYRQRAAGWKKAMKKRFAT